jgi:rubrerythrin
MNLCPECGCGTKEPNHCPMCGYSKNENKTELRHDE